MNDTSSTNQTSRFPFFRRLFSNKTLGRVCFAIACLATLIALFYAEENWREHRAWMNFKKTWEAKGEKFEWDAFIPPAIPDDENFAMAPFFEGIRLEMEANRNGRKLSPYDTNRINQLALSINLKNYDKLNPTPSLGYWTEHTNTDLAAWQKYYRYRGKNQAEDDQFPIAVQPQSPAQDVLLALGKYADPLELLREASRRPASRFPINHKLLYQDPVSHLSKIKSICNYLDLLSIAELDVGHTTLAASNVDLMFRVQESIKTEPIMISYLVRLASLNLILNVIWEGDRRQQWSEEQLRHFQHTIEQMDFLAEQKQASRGELAMALYTLDQIAHLRMKSIIKDYLLADEELSSYSEKTPSKYSANKELWLKFTRELYIRFAPKGWFDEIKVEIASLVEEKGLAAIQPAEQRIDLALANSGNQEATAKKSGAHSFVIPFFSSAVFSIVKKTVREQTSLNLAATACALERYHLANKNYPATLDELVPRFINKVPREITSGEPLKYRRSENGRFVLYSTGLEGTDFGGESRSADGSRNGNWVWAYPDK